jgi:hypothetical protein
VQVAITIRAAHRLGQSLTEAALDVDNLCASTHQYGYNTRVVRAVPDGAKTTADTHWLLHSLVYLEIRPVTPQKLNIEILKAVENLIAHYRHRLHKTSRLCLLITRSELVVVYNLQYNCLVAVLGYLVEPAAYCCAHVYLVFADTDPKKWHALKKRGKCSRVVTTFGCEIRFTTTRSTVN